MASGSTTVLPCVKACDYSDMSDPAACCGELQRGSRHTYLDACLGEQGNSLGHTVLQPVLHSCGPKQLKVTLNLLCHLGNLLIPALQADTRLMEALVPLLQSSYSCEKVWRLCGLVRRFWLAAGASFRQADTGSVEALAPLLITAVTHRRCCLAASATHTRPGTEVTALHVNAVLEHAGSCCLHTEVDALLSALSCKASGFRQSGQ